MKSKNQKIAAIYDIHGNLPALRAVLGELEHVGVDHVVIGGDVIPGPQPAETLNTLLNLDIPIQFIRGNGERNVLAFLNGEDVIDVPEQYHESMRWVGKQFTAQQIEFLSSWPLTITLEQIQYGPILFCHATPRNDTEIFTKLTPENRVQVAFDSTKEPLVVCGHTHMQFDRQVGKTRIVNAGSVGMPFGEPGAHWILIEDEVQFRCTDYEINEASQQIMGSEYPLAGEFVNQYVNTTPSEEMMLEIFEKAAI